MSLRQVRIPMATGALAADFALPPDRRGVAVIALDAPDADSEKFLAQFLQNSGFGTLSVGTGTDAEDERFEAGVKWLDDQGATGVPVAYVASGKRGGAAALRAAARQGTRIAAVVC